MLRVFYVMASDNIPRVFCVVASDNMPRVAQQVGRGTCIRVTLASKLSSTLHSIYVSSM